MIALAIFFWINGPAFFEAWGQENSNVITAYLMMMVVFILWAQKETRQHLKMPLKKAVPGFFIGMIATFLFMNLLMFGGIISPPVFDMVAFWPTVLIQICIVATVEEIIFRGVFLEYTGIIVSSILFAAWHSYAYNFIWHQGDWSSFNWGSMVIVFGIGVLLAIIVENSKDIERKKKIELGLPATIAIHATYNLCVLGAFYVGVL